jgi:hydrogenase maturation protein HypF
MDHSLVEEVTPQGELGFRIEVSQEGERTVTPIPPDVAVCPECVKELFDPQNHRYLYPFITCTLCGPRFTVVRSFPYDRERTSMADFTMCSRCKAEYGDPADRRFHSQTNSCPECGPSLALTDPSGSLIDGDPIVEAVRLLGQGKTVAIKGIGGFHLACDALNEGAVRRLRERKGREEKPFAVMMPDAETVTRFCVVGPEEERLLSSPVAPIVLLRTWGDEVAANVAPFVCTLGVMLPYSPVHHLLFRHPACSPAQRPIVLVMTSGNLSEEPIARGNEEALERLHGLADAFLLHNREIVLRADDSIVRVIAGNGTVFRRSRGMVPGEFRVNQAQELVEENGEAADERSGQGDSNANRVPVVMAAGGDLKNVLAIVKNAQVVPGPHVGDLASPVAHEYFKQSASVLAGYLEAQPERVAVDPHPGYFSSSLAREMELPVEEVFHHHAHAVSLLFEHQIEGPGIFAVFDGTGYGPDATIWGGEFLLADALDFNRAAHIGLFSLPGGEAAIREPARIMAALLATDGSVPEAFKPLFGAETHQVNLWLEAAGKGINSPLTSSAGRLFDAAAAAVGFRRRVTFEGEAAMWLEGIVNPKESGEYKLHFLDEASLVLNPGALITSVAQDILQGLPPGKVAARFHNSMAAYIAGTLKKLAVAHSIHTVGLTGGCFQNRLLTERTVARMSSSGLRVLLHRNVPPNDGGIAIGQAVCALARWRALARG